MGKRTIVILMSLLFVPLCVTAHPVDGLFERYSLKKSVVTVMMPEAMLKKMARRDDNDLLNKFTELKVISINAKDGDADRAAFIFEVRNMLSDYEMLYSVSNGDRMSSVYLGQDGKEAVTFSVAADAVTLLYMKGEIDEQVQDALLNNKIRIKD